MVVQYGMGCMALVWCAVSAGMDTIEISSGHHAYGASKLSEQSPSPHIVIIGAGFSGLAAAYELTKRGYAVSVYEARNRVGGRVFSLRMQDSDGSQHVAELGAQNMCDGGEGEHLRSLAAELGLSIVATSYVSQMMEYHDGGTIGFPESQLQHYNWTAETLWNRLMQLQTESATMAAVLEKLFPDDPLLRQFFSLRLTCYEGGAPERLSSLYTSTLYRMIVGRLQQEGVQAAATVPVLSVEGGNGRIAEEIAARLGDRLHLNKALVSIAKSDDGTFVVRFHDGDMVVADSIVLTIPCPVYRDIIFEDGVIPDEQLAGIRSIEYGGGAKILVPVLEQDASRAVANAHAIAWKVGVHDPVTLYYREPYGSFTHDTLQEKLAQDLSIVRTLHTVRSTVSAPCMARDESFAVYGGIVGHSWLLDPFARGSYSYINAGTEELFMAVSELYGEPVRKLFAPAGNLFFAGEHTTVLLDVLGTMEAAVESGIRTARMIEQMVLKR